MRYRHSLPAAALVILLGVAVCLAAALPEMPPRYVVDLAGAVEDNVEMKLNGYLQELEQKTTAQVIVLTLDSLEGIPLEDYSLQVAESWKLGRKDRDNGLLILFAMKERKYRFEVGYGLEGILPDSRVGSIGRQYIVPYFRQGDYTSGIAGAALAVATVIARDSAVEITGMPRLRTGGGDGGGRPAGKPGILGTIFSILFFVGLIYMFIRHPRMLILLFLFSGMGGRRGHWGGGGGFGGGGFGGGGGGGFGGGGASGGW